jgi:hypothetical protein
MWGFGNPYALILQLSEEQRENVKHQKNYQNVGAEVQTWWRSESVIYARLIIIVMVIHQAFCYIGLIVIFF